MKRKRSTTLSITEKEENKRQQTYYPEKDLLTALTNVLSEIRSTPSRGEISAELMETFKVLLLQIEELSSDETNTEAKLVKDESERCLESWLEDLLAQCEAEGELFSDLELSENEELALALVLESEDEEGIDEEIGSQEEEEEEQDFENDDDDDSDDDEEEQYTNGGRVIKEHVQANSIIILDHNDHANTTDDEDDEEIIIVDDDDLLDAQQIQIMT